MYFTPQTLRNPNTQAHWRELWANRLLAANVAEAMVAQHRGFMTPDMIQANSLEANALAAPGEAFWQQIDRQVLELRQQTIGMEIVDDLMRVQTVVPIGKTARLYTMAGDIADDVAISIDGQAPFSFDMSENSSDGDPIPVFTAGYGVNWRLNLGLQSAGVDAVLDAQRAKAIKFNLKVVNYMLNGSNQIQVGAYPGQGLKNHRNTVKLNLGASGANIDLTTATAEAIIAFFGTGAFGTVRRANVVDVYDVMWVSQDIWANLQKPYLLSLGGGSQPVINGTVQQAIAQFANVREIRPTYALTGNQFLAYVRRSDVVTPLVGMTTGVTPVPRLMPQHNFNYQMMGAYGLAVTADSSGKGGVVYGAAT